MVVLLAKQAISEAVLAKPDSPFNPSVKAEWKSKTGLGFIKAKKDSKLWYKIEDIEAKTENKFEKIIKSGQKLFKGDDTFKGSVFDDVLKSFAGADVVKAGDGADTVNGGGGADRLLGQGGNDKLFGDVGDDRLDGGDGINTLTGGKGEDHFQFTAAVGAGNQSTITDFEKGIDTIELSRSAFTGIGDTGKLQAKSFFLYPDSSKTPDEHSVIYDKALGELWYTEDGSIISAVLFAKVTPGIDLSHKDFLII